MDEDVGLSPGALDEVKGGLECVASILSVAIVEVEAEMFNFFGIGEMEVDP